MVGHVRSSVSDTAAVESQQALRRHQELPLESESGRTVLSIQRNFVNFGTCDEASFQDMKYLGKGGFALVFKAKQRLPSGELVPLAMKVLKPKHMSKSSHYRRFLQELAVHTAVQHP
jgi:serine/threonine protein kinase